MPSRLDKFYRKLLITKFFEKGWGKPENLERLFAFRKIVSNRETCYKLIPKDYPVHITKKANTSECTILEGQFLTPLELYLPGLVPKAAQQAHFQIVLPKEWTNEKVKPICIHLAGTGDHYYWRRRNVIAKPLVREAGIGAIILENPFYGLRKPEDQVRSNLHNVSDIFVMGGCLILECLVLLNWCERNGFGPLGITGISMGGHMASLAATNWPKPLVLVPCLSWSSASAVFTEGVMSRSINWDMLENQYFADGNFREKLSKMVNVVDAAFMAGKHFVKNFNESIDELRQDIQDTQNYNSSLIINVLNNNKSLIKLNNENSLGLTINLHENLMSGDINELNNKIWLIQEKIRKKLNEKQKEKLIKGNRKSPNLSLTKLIKHIMPQSNKLKNVKTKKIDITKTNWWEREALQFMRGMMDECTHLKNFSVPYDTELIIAVCAKDDAYVPREGSTSLEEIWPGAEIRYLNAGHISAYVLHQKLFRSCIIEAFERAKIKHKNNFDRINDIPGSRLSYYELQKRYQENML